MKNFFNRIRTVFVKKKTPPTPPRVSENKISSIEGIHYSRLNRQQNVNDNEFSESVFNSLQQAQALYESEMNDFFQKQYANYSGYSGEGGSFSGGGATSSWDDSSSSNYNSDSGSSNDSSNTSND